jgi:hypothetical protein
MRALGLGVMAGHGRRAPLGRARKRMHQECATDKHKNQEDSHTQTPKTQRGSGVDGGHAIS